MSCNRCIFFQSNRCVALENGTYYNEHNEKCHFFKDEKMVEEEKIRYKQRILKVEKEYGIPYIYSTFYKTNKELFYETNLLELLIRIKSYERKKI